MPFNYTPAINHTSSSKSHPEPSQDFTLDGLTLLEQIGESKATVFLGHIASLDKFVAVKIFNYTRKHINKYFMNEVMFSHLKHPNIISVLASSHKQSYSVSDDCSVDVSLIVMELAPHGDFFDLLITNKTHINEKLARTYFHQLIDALEYMHNQGVAHQDLKLDNLLLGEDYVLKVSDFDAAWMEGRSPNTSAGTLYYRAPEVHSNKCKDPKAADIYSAGVLLFLFMCGGMLPHTEDQLYEGMNLQDLLYNDNGLFWKKHCEIQNRCPDYFNEDFKYLFNNMTSIDPEKRYTVDQIKASKWYQGEIYTQKEVVSLMQGC